MAGLLAASDLSLNEAYLLSLLDLTKEYFSIETDRHDGILYFNFWWAAREYNVLLAAVPELSTKTYPETKSAILAYAERRKQQIHQEIIDDGSTPEDAQDIIDGFYWMMGIAVPSSKVDSAASAMYKADESVFEISLACYPEVKGGL